MNRFRFDEDKFDKSRFDEMKNCERKVEKMIEREQKLKKVNRIDKIERFSGPLKKILCGASTIGLSLLYENMVPSDFERYVQRWGPIEDWDPPPRHDVLLPANAGTGLMMSGLGDALEAYDQYRDDIRDDMKTRYKIDRKVKLDTAFPTRRTSGRVPSLLSMAKERAYEMPIFPGDTPTFHLRA